MIVDFTTRFDIGQVVFLVDGGNIKKIIINEIDFSLFSNSAILLYNGKYAEHELLSTDEFISFLKKEEENVRYNN